jgi:hypothetical protein
VTKLVSTTALDKANENFQQWKELLGISEKADAGAFGKALKKLVTEHEALKSETQDTAVQAGYKAWGFLKRAIQDGTLTLKGRNWYESTRTPTLWVVQLGPEQALKQQKKYAAMAEKCERDLIEAGKPELVSNLRLLWTDESHDGEEFVECALGLVDPETLDRLEEEEKIRNAPKVYPVETFLQYLENQSELVPEKLWKPLLEQAIVENLTYDEVEAERFANHPRITKNITKWLLHSHFKIGEIHKNFKEQQELESCLERRNLTDRRGFWREDATLQKVDEAWAEHKELMKYCAEHGYFVSGWEEERWLEEYREKQNQQNCEVLVPV